MKVLIAASLPGWMVESQGRSRYGIRSFCKKGLTIAEVVILGIQVKG